MIFFSRYRVCYRGMSARKLLQEESNENEKLFLFDASFEIDFYLNNKGFYVVISNTINKSNVDIQRTRIHKHSI